MQCLSSDLIVIDRALGLYGVGIIDDQTKDIALEFCSGKTYEKIADAIFYRWTSLRGTSEHLQMFKTDEEPSLTTKPALEWFSHRGICKTASAAYDSDGNAAIERLFAEVRDAVDIASKSCAPKNERDCRYLLYNTENQIRSQVQRGGFTSSQRAWGRGVSCILEPWEVTPAESTDPSYEETMRAMEIQDSSRKALFEARCKRVGYEIDHAKERSEARTYSIGELVYYRRPTAPGQSKSQWLGPVLWIGALARTQPLM